MFNSEVELGKFLGSLDVIQEAYEAISETYKAHQFHSKPCAYDLIKNPCRGLQILAFHCSPDYKTRFLCGEFDLVPSSDHRCSDFIATKDHPVFSINRAAADLLENLLVELSLLENQLIHDDPLVVTGRGLGGYVAILFTLWLQQTIDLKQFNGSWESKRPICITFGSPLFGDEALQRLISGHPQWMPCFLNVVAKTDPFASFFTSNSPYEPFGTFLFCTESGGHTAFENRELVLAVLDDMAISLRAVNFEMHDYGNDLRFIRRKGLYREGFKSSDFSLSLFKAGITLQFKEIGILVEQRDNSLYGLIDRAEAKKINMMKKKRVIYAPVERLHVMELHLTYIEWYIKVSNFKGGYYNCYKKSPENGKEIEQHWEVSKHHGRLNQYWKRIVEENVLKPQTKGANLDKRWLDSGTSYRMKVEPLDIAKYYKGGRKKYDYISTRPEHYKLLEKWMIDDRIARGQTNEVASLAEDSCFWAYVEEASASLQNLEGKGSSCNADDIAQGLQGFEENVQRVLAIARSR